MTLKSRKFGLLTQAVLASSVCLLPMSLMAANVDVAADGDVIADGDTAWFSDAATKRGDVNKDATLGLGTGGVAPDIGVTLSADTLTPTKGTLNFLGNTALGGATGAAGGIGQLASKLDSITIAAAPADNVTFGGPIFLANDMTFGDDNQVINLNANANLAKIDFANKNSTLNIKQGVTVAGNIDSTVGANGTVNFLANDAGVTTVTGTTGGAANELALVAVGALTTNLQDDTAATNFTIAAGGTLQMDTAKNIDSTGGAIANNGTLDLKGQSTVTGEITGAGTVIVDSVTGNKSVTFIGGNVAASTIAIRGTLATNSNADFTEPGSTVAANITTNRPGHNNVKLTNTSIMTGNMGSAASPLAAVELASAGTHDITITGDVWANSVEFKADRIATLADNSNFNTRVLNEAGAASRGTLTYAGNSTTGGTIGIGGAGSLLLVNTTGAGKAVNVGHDIAATNITIEGTSTLNVTANALNFEGIFATAGAGSTLNLGANTLNVNGNTTIAALDTLKIDVNDATNGKLAVTGNATNPNGMKLAVNTNGVTPGFVPAGTRNIITDTAGANLSVIPVANIIETDSSAMLGFSTQLANTLGNAGDTLQLVISRAGLDNPTFAPGPQGEGVASSLETAGANGQLTTGLTGLMVDLQNLDTNAEVTLALQTLAPNASGAVIEGTTVGADARMDSVNKRMEIARNGVGSYNTGMSAGDSANGMGLWAQFLVSDFKQKMRGGVPGYKGDNIGMMFGADNQVTDTWLVGAAVGYGTTDIDFDLAGSTVNIDSWQAAVYASWDFNSPWFADGMIGFAHHTYDQKRNIILPPLLRTAIADYNAWEWMAEARVGYEHQEGDWYITPGVSLEYSNLSIDDYNETNAGAANLSVKSKDADSFIAGLGVKAEYRGGMFAPEAHAGVYYDFNASRQETNNVFLGSTVGFDTKGVKPAHESYEVGVGLNVYAMSELTLTLNYDYSFKSDFHSNTGYLKLRYEW
jgi:outer membrane autotransporter protein